MNLETTREQHFEGLILIFCVASFSRDNCFNSGRHRLNLAQYILTGYFAPALVESSPNSAIEAISIFASFLSISAHMFSIGLRSGLFAGQVRSSMSSSSNHELTRLAVWHVAPSCWNITFWFGFSKSTIEGFKSFSSRSMQRH